MHRTFWSRLRSRSRPRALLSLIADWASRRINTVRVGEDTSYWPLEGDDLTDTPTTSPPTIPSRQSGADHPLDR
jgi:hypothetical protein